MPRPLVWIKNLMIDQARHWSLGSVGYRTEPFIDFHKHTTVTPRCSLCPQLPWKELMVKRLTRDPAEPHNPFLPLLTLLLGQAKPLPLPYTHPTNLVMGSQSRRNEVKTGVFAATSENYERHHLVGLSFTTPLPHNTWECVTKPRFKEGSSSM